jgi:CHC2 zinc finger
MMTSKYVIDEIVRNRNITDYLATKGIYPVGGEVNGKLRYHCPVHAADNTPSFMVYINQEFQNYYCYGCKSKYSIIHLYKEMEKLSFADTIKQLSEGLEINVDSEINHIVLDIEKEYKNFKDFDLDNINLLLSRNLYNYTKNVNKDKQYIEYVDKMAQTIDKCVETLDLKGIKKIDEVLPDILAKSVKQYQEKNKFNI